MSVQIIEGDCREILPTLPAGSVHCCVTSPPYFGLRDYGVEGQIGLEQTPDAYVAEMVAVFREVRRVLRDDGTLWLNLGDSYATQGGAGWQGKSGQRASRAFTAAGSSHKGVPEGLKPKDLIGIPWMVAKALQAPFYTGRIKRLEDRVWLAAIIDGEGCFFIHKRRAGSSAYLKHVRADGTEASYTCTADTYGVGLEISNTSKRLIDRVAEIVPGGTFTTQGPEQNGRRKQTIYRWRLSPKDTKRLAQELYPHLVAKPHQARLIFSCPSNGDAGAGAHQAMMDLHNGVETDVDFPAPPSLFEPGWYLRQDIIWGKPNPMPESVRDRCTKAHEYIFLLTKNERYHFDTEAMREEAVYPAGTKGAKGSAARQVEKGVNARPPEYKVYDGFRNRRSVWTVTTKPFKEAHFATFPPDLIEPCVLAGCPIGGVVLDPFGGAGTTAMVASRTQRAAISIELNPAYAAMQRERIAQDAGLLANFNDLVTA
jgi:DNA modification methylase